MFFPKIRLNKNTKMNFVHLDRYHCSDKAMCCKSRTHRISYLSNCWNRNMQTKNSDLCIGHYYCMGNCNSSPPIHSVCLPFLAGIGTYMSLAYFDIVLHSYKDSNDKSHTVCSVYQTSWLSRCNCTMSFR